MAHGLFLECNRESRHDEELFAVWQCQTDFVHIVSRNATRVDDGAEM